MKVKTSVSLSEEVVALLRQCTSEGNRSEFIENAILKYLEWIRRNVRDDRDRHILEEGASGLNQEALDTLAYQNIP
jgi:Arc/MetJ-type ribon-helix-helix transcriptional regulator